MNFSCRCGSTIYDNVIPNPMAFRIISDINLDKLHDPFGLDEVLSRSSQVLQCDRCCRLWIWWKNKSTYFEEYARVDAEGRIIE
jgi:hypothetical protein